MCFCLLGNSSVGTVVDIIYEFGRNPTLGLPDAVMVEFVKYVGPPFIHDRPIIIPVVPYERKLDCFSFSCKRKQIPLRMGWETTIHCCQGMTIGKKES